MKLSLDQLRVDSYASQVSETELTAVRGGDGDSGINITPLFPAPISFLFEINVHVSVQNVNQNSTGGTNSTSPTIIVPQAPPVRPAGIGGITGTPQN